MTETVAEWKERKREQARRIQAAVPGVTIEHWQDYKTKIVAIRHAAPHLTIVVTTGQLARDEIGQPAIDLTDDEIVEALKG